MKSILIVSQLIEDIRNIEKTFPPDFRIDKASDFRQALQILKKRRYDFTFIDLDLFLSHEPDQAFAEKLQLFKDIYPSIQIIVLTPPETTRQAVKLVKAGASDYLSHPIQPDEIKLIIENIEESIIKDSELDYLRDQSWKSDSSRTNRTNSPIMHSVFKQIQSVASTKATVLLSGETGTGKGVIAKLIHQHSNRYHAQFISVHCGAIPDTLLESELFGHEKGAFTGAVRKKLGKFEIAKGGTIFLDEIGTITPPAQIKLLQVLQDGTFNRVGGEETIATDTRIIAATNSDLKQMSDQGLFRKDLYYRLNVFPIGIPSLKERIEDIPLLVDFFLEKLRSKFQKNIEGLHSQVFAALQVYAWPGNIRELENLLERAFILETSAMLTPESFPSELFDSQASTAVVSYISLSDERRKAIEDFERQYLKDLLFRNKGKISKSAQEAGIGTRQLHKLMSKYGIRKEEFKA